VRVLTGRIQCAHTMVEHILTAIVSEIINSGFGRSFLTKKEARKMNKIAIIFCALLLSSCMTLQEQEQARLVRQNALDEQQCLSYGAQPGTEGYITCRTNLSTSRTMAAAAAYRGGVCTKYGATTVCN